MAALLDGPPFCLSGYQFTAISFTVTLAAWSRPLSNDISFTAA